MDAEWSLYIIENKLNHLYTGITKDVQRRFQEHASDGPKTAKALKGKGPLELVFSVKGLSHSEALKLERQIKRLPSKRKRLLINGSLAFDTLRQQNPT